MINYYWLKLHYDILDDWKVGTLPDSLKWLFIQCLCVAGENNDAGFLPEINQFAYRIREEPSALSSSLARLAANQLVELKLDEAGDERWYITNYEKRQAKKEDAQRMRDYRKRQRYQKMAKSDNTVTDKLRSGYDTVTTRNTDKIRIDKNRGDKIRVDVDREFPENALPMEVMAAIATVTKETLAPGFNEDKFENAAHAITALDAVDKIPGFAAWWKRNSYYKDNGKPSIKTFMDEFQNYLDGVERGESAGTPQLTQTQINIQKSKEKYHAKHR